MNLDLQIFTRDPISSQEREPRPNEGWTEHPKFPHGFYNTDIPLWKPENGNKYDGVYFNFNTKPFGGIGINSSGGAEVFWGEKGLITIDEPETIGPVTIVNDRASAKGGRAEIFFHSGATMGLTIKVDGQPVKEIKIVGAFSE